MVGYDFIPWNLITFACICRCFKPKTCPCMFASCLCSEWVTQLASSVAMIFLRSHTCESVPSLTQILFKENFQITEIERKFQFVGKASPGFSNDDQQKFNNISWRRSQFHSVKVSRSFRCRCFLLNFFLFHRKWSAKNVLTLVFSVAQTSGNRSCGSLPLAIFWYQPVWFHLPISLCKWKFNFTKCATIESIPLCAMCAWPTSKLKFFVQTWSFVINCGPNSSSSSLFVTVRTVDLAASLWAMIFTCKNVRTSKKNRNLFVWLNVKHGVV